MASQMESLTTARQFSNSIQSLPEQCPLHVGPKILPFSPIFNRVLLLARRKNKVCIRDVTNDIEADHRRFLSDIIQLRNGIQEKLDTGSRNRLWLGQEVYIALLGPAGYEYVVGFFAIMALGAAVVPISPAAATNEAVHILATSQVSTLLYAKALQQHAADIANAFREPAKERALLTISVHPYLNQPTIPAEQIILSQDHFLSETEPGLVIFTSGTTGPPKGAVMRRSFMSTSSQGIADWYHLTEADTVLHTLPVHHATGLAGTLLPFILSGACIEFQSGGFNAARTWERWRQGGLTVFSGVPTMYLRLMRHYEKNIKTMSPMWAASYVDAARSLRVLMSGSAALPNSLQEAWMKLLGGKRVMERYGSTEMGCVCATEPGDQSNPHGSVGKLYPGIEVKLANGEEGEVLLKTVHGFLKYLGDPQATQNAFTEDNFYKSGDIARREGDYYFILGRASVDILKSGGYKISALDVERAILNLAYVEEVIVVGVTDLEYGQRVAAAIVLKDDFGIRSGLSLTKLRGDLRRHLANYKAPTLLRIVQDLPKNTSGKVLKKQLGVTLFPEGGHRDVQVWKGNGYKL